MARSLTRLVGSVDEPSLLHHSRQIYNLRVMHAIKSTSIDLHEENKASNLEWREEAEQDQQPQLHNTVATVWLFEKALQDLQAPKKDRYAADYAKLTTK